MRWARLFAVAAILLPSSTLAPPQDQHPRHLLSPPTPLPMIQWKGTARCESSETTRCDLLFERVDGEVFPVAENDDLRQQIQDSEQTPTLLVTGQKTPKFLFWGNRLVVHSFKILD